MCRLHNRPARNPDKNSPSFKTPFRASLNNGHPFVMRRSDNCILLWINLTMLQTYLHLLLKISESVARLESLLLIASPDGSSSPELKTLPLKSLGGAGEDSDDRCVLPHRASMLPNVQVTTGREETAQSISFALQQNTLNFSIMFPKRRPVTHLHLLTRFNGSVNCLFSIPTP
jgi:hypothetical protein